MRGPQAHLDRLVTASGLEIRPFGPGDDIEAELDLRRRAFGPVPAAGKPVWAARVQASIDSGQLLGVFDGARPVASARYHSMRQWWHGRPMPMAGVAGVKVAPEDRGRGVGRALMTRLLAEITERGYLVSTLFPSTLAVYRSLGWEVSGGRYETVMPARTLTALTSADPNLGGAAAGPPAAPAVRRATASDAAAAIEVLGRVHEALRDSGQNTREPAEMAGWLEDVDHFAYLAADGFLCYRWADGHVELRVDYLAAASAATAWAFWQILASHATMADRVSACLAPSDPIAWLTSEPTVVTTRAEDWMLRVTDPAQAIAARGYPAAASLAVGIELSDPVLPANSGHWRLEVAGGAGKLAPADERSGGQALRLGAGGLAALFAGVPVVTLRRAGLAGGGDPAADEALDCAFGGTAYMTDYF